MNDSYKKFQFAQYSILLHDVRWRNKCKEILKRDEKKCIICKSKEHLHVHHRQYHFSKAMKRHINPWEYNNFYLITLCENCHKVGHTQYKVPVKEIK